MTVSELIKRLKQIKQEHGDIQVEISDGNYVWDEITVFFDESGTAVIEGW